ncbi:Retrovirus-related Pol polyprotein from transposon RE1 [Vitis vinifera]|uniref:Retrovirus-related Pol polyprotein from transposon RE1 n=1 Tax=Vitis vinifera TaxID=29760 RepID=A0A438HU57_VITVI|nr:Retrovirus-related Pol polyprotein from transposon RE1 [Vitis vinifera]
MPPMFASLHGLSPIALLGSLGPHPHPLKYSRSCSLPLSSFRQQFPQVQPPSRPGNSSQSRPPAPWQAQANVTTIIPSNTTWLLDSGASHHVTTDLHNLALHSPFDGTDEIMIDDGSGLPISHTGSTSLTTPSHSFTLSNSNNTSIEFLPSSFHVKDLHTGAILLQGRTKDGVYEWPLSTTQSRPLIAFSSVKTTLSEWHHRLALDVSAILGFAHTHPTNSSLVPPLASLSGTLPLKVPIYVLTHPSLVYTLPVIRGHTIRECRLCSPSSLLTPTAPSQSQDPSQNNTTCATPTPEPDSHSSVPVPETKCDCANNPPLPPTQNDPNQPPDLSPSPHVIVTRSKHNIHKPIQKLNLTAQLRQPTLEPTTVTQALKDPKWRQAMSAEFDAYYTGTKLDWLLKASTNALALTTLKPSVRHQTYHWHSHWGCVYVSTTGFIDRDHPHHVCKLRKAIYGSNKPHVPVYVDDIIITGNNVEAAQTFIQQLSQRFSLKDLGPLTYFLGVEVTSHTNGLFLSQRKYIADLLNRTHMTEAKPAPTPLATSPILTLQSGTPLSDPTEYRTVVVKRLLRYLCGTLNHGITLRRTSPLALHAFSDSDWAANKDDFTSTSAYIIYLGHNPISWSSKKQRTVARSSLRLNTDRWPLLLQKFVGFALSSPNSVSLFPNNQLFIVIMLVQQISVPIRSFTRA